MDYKKQLLATAICSAIGLTACSGGGSSSSSDTSGNEENASISVSGVAIKGVMINADVTVYELGSEESLGATTTNSAGEYSLDGIDLSGVTGPLKVVMTTNTNTTTKCDSAVDCQNGSDTITFGTSYPFHDTDFELTAILPNSNTGSATLMITPVTHMAAARAEASGATTQSEIEAINAATANLLGLEGIDIATAVPSDLTDASSADDSANAQHYGAILAAIATVSAEKGHSLAATIDQITSNYVQDDGLVANSDSEEVIDLEDIFSGAADSITKAEEVTGENFNDGIEAALVSDQSEAETADSGTVIIEETDPTEAEATATEKGVALLEELNQWHATAIDVESQLTQDKDSLTAKADDLAALAEGAAESTDLLRGIRALAYGITEEYIEESYSYNSCSSYNYNAGYCEEYSTYTYDYSWTEEHQTAVLPNATDLVGDFVSLTSHLSDDLDYTLSQSAFSDGMYTLIINETFANQVDYLIPFFYDYKGDETFTPGLITATFSTTVEDGETFINHVSFTARSSVEGDNAPILVNSLDIDSSRSDDAPGLQFELTNIDMTIPSAGLLGHDSDIEMTYTGSGLFDMAFTSNAALDLYLDNPDIALEDVLLSMSIDIDTDVSENSDDAAAEGVSPTVGSIDFSMSMNRESKDDDAEATMELVIDVHNEAGDLIQGTLSGSTQIDMRAADMGDLVANRSNLSFNGTLSAVVDDEMSDYDGASTQFTGSVSLDAPVIDNGQINEMTTSFEGSYSVVDANGTGMSFEGDLVLTYELPQNAAGEEIVTGQYEEYGWYYYSSSPVVETSGPVPTLVSLAGTLATQNNGQPESELTLTASLVIENMQNVAAGVSNTLVEEDDYIGSVNWQEPSFDLTPTFDIDTNSVSFNFNSTSGAPLQEVYEIIDDYASDISILAGYEVKVRSRTYGISNMVLIEDGCEPHAYSYEYYYDDTIEDYVEEMVVDSYSCHVRLTKSNIYEEVDGESYENTYSSDKDIYFSAAEYENGDHLDPESWYQVISNGYYGYDSSLSTRMQAYIDVADGDGYVGIEIYSSESGRSDIDVSYVYIDQKIARILADNETSDNYINIGANIKVDLGLFDYEDATAEVTVNRVGQEEAETSLTLSYGPRVMTVDLDISGEGLDADGTQVVISNGSTTMTLTASCTSADSEAGSSWSNLATCDDADLNYGGLITVDNVQVGTLEDRSGLPVFVFNDGSEYDLVATPAFLISNSQQ